eukprot:3263422-Pyramimonas_sp.AAC.1
MAVDDYRSAAVVALRFAVSRSRRSATVGAMVTAPATCSAAVVRDDVLQRLAAVAAIGEPSPLVADASVCSLVYCGVPNLIRL